MIDEPNTCGICHKRKSNGSHLCHDDEYGEVHKLCKVRLDRVRDLAIYKVYQWHPSYMLIKYIRYNDR